MSHTCKGWMKISGLLELELQAAISLLIWVLRENPMEKQNQLLNTNPALQPDTHHVLLNYDISWMSSISSLIIEISSSSTYAGERERDKKREVQGDMHNEVTQMHFSRTSRHFFF